MMNWIRVILGVAVVSVVWLRGEWIVEKLYVMRTGSNVVLGPTAMGSEIALVVGGGLAVGTGLFVWGLWGMRKK